MNDLATVDLRELSEGDEIHATIAGDDDLSGTVTEIERQESSAITEGYVRATVETAWNGDTPANATIERLTLRQTYSRRHAGAHDARLHAEVWPDNGDSYQRVEIGNVKAVQVGV